MSRYSERIRGGHAKGMRPSDFDKVQLERGTRVELEHTTNREVAREIAMDHLAEDPRYYHKLAKIHSEGDSHGRQPNPGSEIYAMSNPTLKRKLMR